MAKQFDIQPKHIGRDVVQLDEVYTETLEPRWTTERSKMQTFYVGIGWNSNYISYGSRAYYSTYEDRMHDECVRLRADAHHNGDEVINWIKVYAHDRQHVVKLYSYR